MNLMKLGLGALVIALSACPGGNNNNDPVCGNGTVEAGEQCDDGNTVDGDGCSAICAEESGINLECPRLVELNKFCVPLPGSGEVLAEVGPNDNCGAGFFPSAAANNEAFEVRKLFNDVILIKETNGQTGERPVMVLFLGEGKALLYDSGHVTTAVQDVIAPFLEGRSVELINTHLHGDHVNNNNGFDVIAIESSDNVVAHCQINDNSFDTNQAAACNNAQNFNPNDFQTLDSPETYKVVRVVRDGHVIDLGGHLITVLFTPGHSQTSITLHDTTRRLLFTGDTLYPDTDVINGVDNGIPLVHPNGSDFNNYLATAQKYAALEVDIDIVIGAHSQGVMPARSLGAFLTFVQNRVNNSSFNDPEGCDAGNFSIAGFPP
jgi:cysteine-rich repeat protein